MKTWFAIETSLIDRDDLTTYEKLCGIVMARYAGRPEFNHLITVETLAKKMAISVEDTHKALSGLFDKGLITEEISTSMDLKFDNNSKSMIEDLSSVEEDILPRNLIKLKEQQRSDFQMDTVKPMQMPSWDDGKTDLFECQRDDMIEADVLNMATRRLEKAIKSDEKILSQIMDLIQEPINARQGRIILGLANRDVDKIQYCYRKVQKLEYNRIDALIECLQTGDYKTYQSDKYNNSDAQLVQSELSSNAQDISLHGGSKVGGQVNKYRIQQMKKYGKYKKNKT